MQVRLLEINVNQSKNQSIHELTKNIFKKKTKKLAECFSLSVNHMKVPIVLLGLVYVCVYGMQNKGVGLRAPSSRQARRCWRPCLSLQPLTEDALK